MIILVAVIVGIVIGLIRKGSFERLANSLKAPFFIIISIIPEMFSGVLAEKFPQLIPRYLWVLVLIQYLLIFAFLILNVRNRGIVWMFIGVLLNFGVIMANGGRMPVAPKVLEMPVMQETAARILAGEFPEYFIMTEWVPLWYLGDVIPIPIWGAGMASIGDFFMMAGMILLIMYTMVHGRKYAEPKHFAK